ncbi:MAG: paraquat-inducible protein A [Oxalobacteraceae bacterium]|nr:paraquat-inducible protein A [Oxalobacteraceae bacterium]
MSEPRPPPPVTAAARGLLRCHACDLLCQPLAGAGASNCPRCAAPLHQRIPHSIRKTWAFLLAAMILYIPANLLPIMRSSSFFSVRDDTILSGVVYLWIGGSRMLALLVFVASIVIPLFKLLALVLLTLSVQLRSTWQPRQRTRMYRLVEAIGRWSMLDIYVVALLVALVQVQSFARIEAGQGAAAFGAVVVLTLLAANSFDPRLIWDYAERQNMNNKHTETNLD